jgi:hypothetical protein
METKQPKKRGRKPKIKLEEKSNLEQTQPLQSNETETNLNVEPLEMSITTDVIPQKKKRGRKPKPKPDVEEVKTPKKRGRKPKEIFKPTEPSNFQISEEAVILHLNIKNNKESILNIEDEFVKYNPSINIPTPFIPDDLENAFYLKDNGHTIQTFKPEDLDKHDSINELQGSVDTSIPEEINVSQNTGTDNFDTNNMKMNINIEEQFKNNTKNIDTERTEYTDSIGSDKNKCVPIFIEYAEANKKNTWPSKTNIDCFWCCYPFDNTPFGIPIKRVGEKYQMFGNFCCAECAAAYIFETNFLNDSEKTESYSLLNYLYRDGINDGIQIASSKLCLKKFGGRLSIDQYRNNLKTSSKNYKVIIPPLTSIIPNVEETNISKSLNDIGASFLTNSIVSKSGELLRLKRQKPLPDSNNTLEACMNLKLL